MNYRISRQLNGELVWFQGLIPGNTLTLDIVWTTIEDEACSFGRYEAAVDTAKAIGGEAVERP